MIGVTSAMPIAANETLPSTAGEGSRARAYADAAISAAPASAFGHSRPHGVPSSARFYVTANPPWRRRSTASVARTWTKIEYQLEHQPAPCVAAAGHPPQPDDRDQEVRQEVHRERAGRIDQDGQPEHEPGDRQRQVDQDRPAGQPVGGRDQVLPARGRRQPGEQPPPAQEQVETSRPPSVAAARGRSARPRARARRPARAARRRAASRGWSAGPTARCPRSASPRGMRPPRSARRGGRRSSCRSRSSRPSRRGRGRSARRRSPAAPRRRGSAARPPCSRSAAASARGRARVGEPPCTQPRNSFRGPWSASNTDMYSQPPSAVAASASLRLPAFARVPRPRQVPHAELAGEGGDLVAPRVVEQPDAHLRPLHPRRGRQRPPHTASGSPYVGTSTSTHAPARSAYGRSPARRRQVAQNDSAWNPLKRSAATSAANSHTTPLRPGDQQPAEVPGGGCDAGDRPHHRHVAAAHRRLQAGR